MEIDTHLQESPGVTLYNTVHYTDQLQKVIFLPHAVNLYIYVILIINNDYFIKQE